MKRARRVALTVPNFMLALTLLAETDLIAALPRHLAASYAAQFGLTAVELPLPVARNKIRVVVPKAALMDAGVAWLFETLVRLGRRRGRGRCRGRAGPAVPGLIRGHFAAAGLPSMTTHASPARSADGTEAR